MSIAWLVLVQNHCVFPDIPAAADGQGLNGGGGDCSAGPLPPSSMGPWYGLARELDAVIGDKTASGLPLQSTMRANSRSTDIARNSHAGFYNDDGTGNAQHQACVTL